MYAQEGFSLFRNAWLNLNCLVFFSNILFHNKHTFKAVLKPWVENIKSKLISLTTEEFFSIARKLEKVSEN